MAHKIQIQREDGAIFSTHAAERARYTPEKAIFAKKLYSINYSLKQICEALGGNISPTTVRNWIHDINKGAQTLSTQYDRKLVTDSIKDGFEDALYMVARRSLAAIDEGKMEKASAFHCSLITKNFLEIIRLQNGQSTQNISVINKFISESDDELSLLESEIDKLEGKIEDGSEVEKVDLSEVEDGASVGIVSNPNTKTQEENPCF